MQSIRKLCCFGGYRTLGFPPRFVDIKKMEAKGDLREDPDMHPGDTLFVPKDKLSKIMPSCPAPIWVLSFQSNK